MGLYSTNRVCGLAPEVFTEEAYDPSFGSIMETAIQICENDQKMFDTLIECDFLSAHTEATMLEEDATAALLEQDDAKKKGILQKIKDLINAVISAIKKAASNFIAKINNIISNDKKIYERYEKNLTVANLQGFKGIKKFKMIDLVINQNEPKNSKVFDVYKNSFINKAYDAQSKDEIDNAYDEMKEALSSIKTVGEDIYFEDEVEDFVPDDKDIQKIKSVVKASNTLVKGIKDNAAARIKELKAVESAAKDAIIKGKNKKDAGEVAVYASKKVYDATSAVTKAYTHRFAQFTNIAARQLATARKAFLICGKYCNKKAKGENPNETEDQATAEAVDYAVMESSDEYIFSELGY